MSELIQLVLTIPNHQHSMKSVEQTVWSHAAVSEECVPSPLRWRAVTLKLLTPAAMEPIREALGNVRADEFPPGAVRIVAFVRIAHRQESTAESVAVSAPIQPQKLHQP